MSPFIREDGSTAWSVRGIVKDLEELRPEVLEAEAQSRFKALELTLNRDHTTAQSHNT